MNELQIASLKMLLDQARLSAEAAAVASGRDSATLQEIANSIFRSLVDCEMWKPDQDTSPISHFARGEIGATELAKYLPERFQ